MISHDLHFRLTQKVLKSCVKKEFGQDIKIKICGLTFICNRQIKNLKPLYKDKIFVITKKELTQEIKVLLKDFLMKKLSQINVCITGEIPSKDFKVELNFISSLKEGLPKN